MAEDPELKKIIPRINELAHKAKLQDLTDKEKEERDQLRKHYLKRFKSNFKSQIEMTQIYDKDGKLLVYLDTFDPPAWCYMNNGNKKQGNNK